MYISLCKSLDFISNLYTTYILTMYHIPFHTHFKVLKKKKDNHLQVGKHLTKQKNNIFHKIPNKITKWCNQLSFSPFVYTSHTHIAFLCCYVSNTGMQLQLAWKYAFTRIKQKLFIWRWNRYYASSILSDKQINNGILY